MAEHVYIADIADHEGDEITVKGWLYNRRSSKKLRFLQLRDGTGFLQAVVAEGEVDDDVFALSDRIPQESSLEVTGVVRRDERAPYCGYELGVRSVRVVHEAEPYPITKKAHGDAFLMDHRHLWLRSYKQHTILRVRATLIRALRDYLDERGFVCLDSPIFTPSACEGTTTLFETRYFDRSAYLSQSGQLYQEACCMAFAKTYCFGPTFRSEKSKTRRHLTEFWMLEPEVAYMDLEGDMALIEDLICYAVQRVLERHGRELRDRLGRDTAPLEEVRKPFPRITYDEALAELARIREQTEDPELREQLAIEWGQDFGAPHETELAKRYARPLMVYRWPAQCKAFYMKKEADDGRYVRAVDVLAPEGYGEIVGGSEREDDYETLRAEIERHDLSYDDFSWYLDLRRYGSVPHAGFGLGLERTVAWICGVRHLRETIPFPRTMDRLRP